MHSAHERLKDWAVFFFSLFLSRFVSLESVKRFVSCFANGVLMKIVWLLITLLFPSLFDRFALVSLHSFFISFACFLSSNRGFETLLPSFVFCTVCALYAKQNYENVHQTQKTRIKKQSLYFGATAIGDCDGEKFKTKRNHCGKSPTEKAFKSTKMQENSAKESVRTSESAWK